MHKSGYPTSVNTNEDYKHRVNGLNHPYIDYSSSSTALDVVRHYVNPAVYIESKISDTDNLIPFKKSPSFECFIAETPRPPRIVKVKRCVCLTNVNSCLVHLEDKPAETEESSKLSAVFHDTERSETDSGIRRSSSMIEDELHLSIPSLTSINTAADSKDIVANNALARCSNRYGSARTNDTESDAMKEQRYLEWCARKDSERHLLEQKEYLIKQIKEKQREMQLEKERENFKKWLANKKLEEEERKKQIEEVIIKKKMQDDELKEKRLVESKLTYQIWLRRKEEKMLEKKIKEQLLIMKATDEKQKREDYNRKAYELWLVQSKNKPRPIPLNQGLQTLRSSASVTYINPKPWVPNVDIKPKPASQ